MENCKICEGSKNSNNLAFETKLWKATLADDQYYLGRCFIDLKRHASSLSELTKEEILDFLDVVKKIESALKKSFNAEMFNWTCLMNNAYKNTPSNPHVHWHFRPRYRDKFEFLDLIFEDKEFGHHYERKTDRILPEDIRTKIIERIRENL